MTSTDIPKMQASQTADKRLLHTAAVMELLIETHALVLKEPFLSHHADKLEDLLFEIETERRQRKPSHAVEVKGSACRGRDPSQTVTPRLRLVKT